MHSYRVVPAVAALPLMLVLAIASCVDASPGGARTSGTVIVDDFGDTIAVGAPIERVVSLSPATTELVFAVGAGSRLVGRSHWDTFPDSARSVPDLGDGMRPNVEAVLATRPDLVILYASGENRAARDALHRAGVRTYTRRLDQVAHFSQAVVDLGRLLGDSARAVTVRDTVQASLQRARELALGRVRPRVVWPLWSSPLLVAGGTSFLTELIDIAGGTNVFGDQQAPSPQVSFEEVVRRDPDAVLVGPAQEQALLTDPRWRALRAVREGRVLVYDTLLVGRPGVRLGEAALHLAGLLHATGGTRR